MSTGRSVAIPGFWAAYEAAPARLGTLPTEQFLHPDGRVEACADPRRVGRAEAV